MISSFSIGNFKAFAKTQTIPIKPLTLIYGPNSSGKSSIIHSLLWAQHAHETGELDVHHTKLGGASLDLGGFNQYVFAHITSGTIDLSFNLTSRKKKFSYLDQILKFNPRIELQIDCHSIDSRSDPSVELRRFEIILGKESLIKMRLNKSGTLSVDTIDDSSILISEFIKKFTNQAFPTKMIDLRTYMIDYLTNHESMPRKGLLPNASPNIQVSDILDVFKGIAIKNSSSKDTTSKVKESLLKVISAYPSIFMGSILRPIQNELDSFFANMSYLGPLRVYPTRHTELSKYIDPNWYSSGGMAWESIRKDKQLRERVNAWLSDSSITKTPYEIKLSAMTDKLRLIEGIKNGLMVNDLEKNDLSHNPSQKLANIIDSVSSSDLQELYLMDKRSPIMLSPCDVGMGISQVIPVIAYAYGLVNSTIAIEQPEIHVHPSLQADLGDVFIESAIGKNNNRFIIETHSEHLILRILRRIREASEGSLSQNRSSIKPDDVAVLWVSPDKTGSSVHEIPITPDGDFAENWPEGFFPERARELF